jgi:holo-[acyl-carrier protein] synthase
LSIVGIGTDLVEIDRLAALQRRYARRLGARILAPAEQADFAAYARLDRASAAFLARRFAAKEAAAKALGCGIGARARLTELAVTHSADGAPILTLTGAARRQADALAVQHVHLSISDERGHALAFVLLER